MQDLWNTHSRYWSLKSASEWDISANKVKNVVHIYQWLKNIALPDKLLKNC